MKRIPISSPTPDMRAVAEQPPSLKELLFVILVRKWLVLGVFLTVLGVTAFVVGYLLSPLYEASSTLLINVGSISAPIVDGIPPSDFEKLSTFQTQKDVISSVAVIAPVVERLRLAERRKLSRLELLGIWYRDQKRLLGKQFGIAKWTKPDDAKGAAIDAVLTHLDVVTKTDSQLLKIVYRARDPAEAEETLRALVAEYTEQFYGTMRSRAGGLMKYLDLRLDATKTDLASAETAVLDFRRRDRIVLETLPVAAMVVDGQGAAQLRPEGGLVPDGDASAASGARRPATAARAAPVAEPPARISGMVGITDNPQVQNELKIYVLAMEESLRKLQPYTDHDPEAVELRRRIANYEAVLNALPAREIEFMRLKREFESVQDTYVALRKNVERARLFSEAGTDRMQIINVQDAATAGTEAVSPKVRLALGLAAVFGLVFGVICAFTLDHLDPTIRSVRDAERTTGLRVIGALRPF